MIACAILMQTVAIGAHTADTFQVVRCCAAQLDPGADIACAASYTCEAESGRTLAYPFTLADLKDSSTWRIVDRVFVVFFAAELALRFYADRCDLFRYSERWWNAFEVILFCQATVSFLYRKYEIGLGVLRALRFVRILRMVRLMRLFQSFRTMIFSIIHSIPALFWSLLLMVFLLFVFAFALSHGLIHVYGNLPATTRQQLDVYYPSLTYTSMTLFMAIAGGYDWHELVNPLHKTAWFLPVGFYLFIFFMVFGVLNVVTSVFVDSAYQVSQKDPEVRIQRALAAEQRYIRQLQAFFSEVDLDNSKTISWDEFQRHLLSDEAQVYLASLEIDHTHARHLFDLLDEDGTGELDIEELIEGCLRLKGTAKSVDVALILHKHELLRRRLEDQFKDLRRHFGLMGPVPVSEGSYR